MICCIYQIAGDKNPPSFSQSSTAVSASQLFRAHISTRLSIPVQVEVLEMQPWREKLPWRSPEFTLKQCRTVFFLSQADFLFLKCNFGYSSLQGFSPYRTSCPFFSARILPCHHPGPSVGRTGCCIATRQNYVDSEGENARKLQHLWEV